MFKRLLMLCCIAITPVPALAQSVQDQIINQLTTQGFADFDISRTLLGRIRILTKSSTLKRELVFNPNSGEILRDYWEPLTGGRAIPQLLNPISNDSNNNGESTKGEVDSHEGKGGIDDRDDDDNDDDNDRDRSENDDKADQERSARDEADDRADEDIEDEDEDDDDE